MFPINSPPINNQLFSGKLTAAASSQKARLSLKKWDIHSLWVPIRTCFCHQLCPQAPPWTAHQSLERVSTQHSLTYLNVCTIRDPEASLFDSSYCQSFPKYEADHINTNCSHLPDRFAGGKEKKKKKKEKSVQHLVQALQSFLAVKQHKPARSSCTKRRTLEQHERVLLRNSTKRGENADKLEPERNISRCTVLIDLISPSFLFFLEV